MSDDYRVDPQSPFEAKVNDVALRETTNTRLIFRPELVTNQNDAAASVHGQLMHQKQHPGGKGWQDADSFRLATLKGGEEVKLYLDAEATQRHYRALDHLYRLPVGWTAPDDIEYVVVDKRESYVATGREKQLIEDLIESEGDHFWDHISALRPGLLEVVALRREQQARQSALAEFEQHMQHRDWTEAQWQRFFSSNEWIFGHNLAFPFVRPVREQAHVGGTTLERKGGRLSDWMLATEAEARFVVLVDIKKPQTELLDTGAYRTSGIYQPSDEVTGGVAQLQVYCRTWVAEGSRQEKNAAVLAKAGIYTYEPRAILAWVTPRNSTMIWTG